MRLIRLFSLLLIPVFLLSGCYYNQIFSMLQGSSVTFDQMEYSRPDISAIQAAGNAALEAVEKEEPMLSLTDTLLEFENLCTDYITSYQLSNIHYSMDLTDLYWEEEYNYCLENVPQLEQIQELVYRALARCPYRKELESDEWYGDGFFDDYDGELLYDDYYLSLAEKEAELESRYYALCDEADPTSQDYYDTQGLEMAELFVELVALRQKMAEYAGYPSFAHYSYENDFGRDYTPEEAEAYLLRMGEALLPVYYDVCMTADWSEISKYCSEANTFQYVKQAANAMGGTVSEAFSQLERYKLYDISYGENKYNASFEVFLPSYWQPFIFVNPNMNQSDKLTFAHEFGHFANDYACGGSYAGIDVAEVHSQSFEYLSLCYSRNSQELANYKMADSVFSFMQCSAHALFELQVYQLPAEELTVANILAIREDIDAQFGFDLLNWDSRDYVQITHFYTSPMYMVSYVVSNDLAMQIYQLELEESGKGLALYNRCLESNDSRIVGFAQTYGLTIPFAKSRPQKLAEFFMERIGLFHNSQSIAA